MAHGVIGVLAVSVAAACANGGADAPDPSEAGATANPDTDAGEGTSQKGDDGAAATDTNDARAAGDAMPRITEGPADAGADAEHVALDGGADASADTGASTDGAADAPDAQDSAPQIQDAGPDVHDSAPQAEDAAPDAHDAAPEASVDSGTDAGTCAGGGTLEVEPNGSAATANTLSGTVCGVVSPGTESDFFRFSLKPTTNNFSVNFSGNISLTFVVQGQTVIWKSPNFPGLPFVRGVEYSVEVRSSDASLQAYRITFTET